MWDKQRDDLVSHETVRLGSMLLDEQYRPATPGDATVAALVERVRATRLGVLNWTAKARAAAPAHWPSPGRTSAATGRRVDDKTLLATLDDWLVPFLHRATSRADIAAVDLEMVLTTMLSWDQQTQLAALVPATLDDGGWANRGDRLRARQPDGVGASAGHVRHR